MNRKPVTSFSFERPSFIYPSFCNEGVADDALLPIPSSYQLTKLGAAGQSIKHIAAALLQGRSLYVYGPTGSGKDAVFHAFSHMTRTPAKVFQIMPSTDIRSWLYSRAIGSNGTMWEEGELLKAVRDGYTCADGKTIPYLIVMTDFDRADPSQAEVLRMILDTTKGRIPGPGGIMYNVFPGTRIVATANTSGGGDDTGRMVSSRVIDTSIKSRFERVVKLGYMEWAEEERILVGKLSGIWSRLDQRDKDRVKSMTATLRASCEKGLAIEFGHRELCRWLGHAEDLLVLNAVRQPWVAVTAAFIQVIDDCPTPEDSLQIRRLAEPILGVQFATMGSIQI